MWVQLFLWIATTLLTDYFRDPLPTVTASGLGDFTIPTATEGRFVPLAFGTSIIQGPNVTWYGDFVAKKRTVTTGLVFKKDETIGFTYFLGMQMGLIRGETAGIKRIWVGDDVVWDYNADNGGVISDVCDIDIDDLFGGVDGGGGWVGRVRLFNGSPTQGQSDYLKYETRVLAENPAVSPQFLLTERMANLPNYRGFSYVTLSNLAETVNLGFFGGIREVIPAEIRGLNIGESNQMRHMKFEIQTFDTVANGGLGDSMGLGNDHHFIGEDLNPISLAYDLFTNQDWGRGFSPADMNLANFKAAAETIWEEGLGFSLVIDQVQSAADLIDTIEQHIDGYIGPNPITGEIEVILARQDYVAADEFQADASNIITVSKYSRGEYNQTFNEVRVQYGDRTKDYKDTYAPAQDLANLIIQGRPRNKTMRFSGVHEASVANKIVWREIRGLAVALASATVELDRTAWNLQPGKVVVVTDAEVGIVEVPFRIIQIRQGDPTKASILLDIVEDVFGNEVVAFTDPPETEFIPPTNQSFALTEAQQLAMEAPYTLTRNDPDFPDRYPRLYVAARHLDNVLRFEVNVDETAASSPTGFDVEAPDLGGISMIVGSLRETLTPWQSGNGTFTIDVGPLNGNLEEIVGEHTPGGIGNLSGVCVINPGASNEEWILTDTIDWLAESPAVGRVQLQNVYRSGLDSAMHDHTIGERIWFIWTGSAGMIIDKQYPESNTLDVKLLPITQTDRVNLTDSPEPPSALPVVIDSDARYIKPLLPIELNFDNYGNFPVTTESPENMIDFEEGHSSIPPIASPEADFQGGMITPKPRLFRNENVIWQVEGLDDANTSFDAAEMQADKMRISWWIYDLDATPSAIRDTDDYARATDVPWLTPDQTINLLKSQVPTAGRDTNVFNARIEIEVSHSPADVHPTSPEAYATSREVMYFDFVVTALFVIPDEAIIFYTRFEGDNLASECYDIGYYSDNRAGIPIGEALLTTAQSVFGGTSGYIPDEPAGYQNLDVAGWHFPGPPPQESPSTTLNWNNEWTMEFRVRIESELTVVDKTFFSHSNVNSRFNGHQTSDRMRIYYDESAGNINISYLRQGSLTSIHTLTPNNKWFPSPVQDQWFSIAIVKRNLGGNDWRGEVYIDGELLDVGNTQNLVWEPWFEADMIVGYNPNTGFASAESVKGWMDEVRLTMGYALYSVDYTLPENKSPTEVSQPTNVFPSPKEKVCLLASFFPGDGKGGLADQSINQLEFERGGTTDIEPYSPFNGSPDGEGPYWSLRCDGVDSTTENTADGAWLNAMEGSPAYRGYDWGSRDWTMEVWMMERIVAEGDGTAIMSRYNRPSARISWWWWISVNYQVSFGWSPTGSISSQVAYQSTGVPATSPLHDAIALNEWHHHVVERKDDDLYMWLDGTLIGYSGDFFIHVDAINGNELQNQTDNALALGRFFDVSSSVRTRALDGWITEPRITVGEAIYADALTESPLPFFGSPPIFGPSSPKGPARSPEFTYTVPTQPFTEIEKTAFRGVRTTPPDPATADCKFLTHWIGAAGSPLLTPVDESIYARPMSAYGGGPIFELDTLTPFPDSTQRTGSLRCTPGTSPIGFAFIPDDVIWDIDLDDCCFETYVMFAAVPTASPYEAAHFIGQYVGTSNDRAWRFFYDGINGLSFGHTSSGSETTLEVWNVPWTPVAGPSPEQWYHVSMSRKNGHVYFHIDGVYHQPSRGPSKNSGTPNVARSLSFGSSFDASTLPYAELDGWLAETRITLDHYVYEPEDFTPRTEPFDHHLTSFMPGPDRRVGNHSAIIDHSWLELPLEGSIVFDAQFFNEQAGDAYFNKPSPDDGVNPFYPMSWTAENNGEPIEFDYDAGRHLADGPFTIETFLYMNDLNRNDPMGDWDTTGSDRQWLVFIESTGHLHFAWSTDGINVADTAIWLWNPSPRINTWFHMAIVRDNTQSPQRLRAYIDGVELTSASPDVTENISGASLHDPTTGGITYGSGDPSGFASWDGRLEESRVMKKVLYSGNFTPPTERLRRY